MKPTVTLGWKAVGFGTMIGLGLLLAIMPSRLAGASLETRLADVSASMPERGFVVTPGELADWIVDARPLLVVDVREHWAHDEIWLSLLNDRMAFSAGIAHSSQDDLFYFKGGFSY